MSNANCYHGSGRHYTTDELRARRVALARINYVCMGYQRKVDKEGMPIIEARIIPYRRRHGE